jgi:hypothetical protein
MVISSPTSPSRDIYKAGAALMPATMPASRFLEKSLLLNINHPANHEPPPP